MVALFRCRQIDSERRCTLFSFVHLDGMTCTLREYRCNPCENRKHVHIFVHTALPFCSSCAFYDCLCHSRTEVLLNVPSLLFMISCSHNIFFLHEKQGR